MFACGAGREDGAALVIYGDAARVGEREVVAVGPDGIEHRGKVPSGPVIRHLHVIAIGVGDGMVVAPGKIVFDTGAGKRRA